jgi:sugar (pentulose or hexulose) kinase
MDMEGVIGVDIGTSECKVIIVNKEGQILGEGGSSLAPFTSPEPGWAEEDTSDWWVKFNAAMKQAIATSRVSPDSITALGITTQRKTFVPVDDSGEALRPAILWIDTRVPIEFYDRYHWIRDNEPEVFANTRKFLSVHAWLIYRLTGLMVDSNAAQFAAELQDIKTREWDTSLLKKFDISPSHLPDLVMPGEKIGPILANVAEELGLPEKLPIVGGCGDKQSGTMGAGCCDDGMLMISYGTAIALGTNTSKPVGPPLMCEFSAIPDTYDAQTGLSGGFWMSRWLMREFGHFDGHNSGSNSLSILEKFNSLAEEAPPGSQGLIVLPHWWGGQWARTPTQANTRGLIFGWNSSHTKAHFFRAVLEGLVLESRLYKEMMEKSLKTTFSEIRIVGGGSNSDLVMQIAADVLGQSVYRTQTSSAEALGAAMCAARGAGFYDDMKDAVRDMSHTTTIFRPNLKNQELYDVLYKGVYSKLYETMKPFSDFLLTKWNLINGEPSENA